MRNHYFIGLLAAACIIGCSEDSSTSANDAPDSSATATYSSDSGVVGPAPTSSDSPAATSSNSQTSNSNGFPANYNAETGVLTDERDGDVYRTAKVGDQIWMAENMRIDDTPYLLGCESNLDSPNWRNPPDTTLKKYGRYYAWITAMQLPCEYKSTLAITTVDSAYHTPHQGLCPKGWHIPTMTEWQTLLDQGPVTQLLSTEWDYKSPDYKGTDDYGLSIPIPNEKNEAIPCYLVASERSKAEAYTACFNTYPSRPIKTDYIDKGHFGSKYLRCLMD